MNDALRTFIDVQPIDLALAASQHEGYRRMLERAGATVVVLAESLAYADAVFVEDTAIVLDEVAVLTSMGAPSRRDEPSAIEPELRRHRPEIARIEAPATIEGGDVLRVGRALFVGATARTNTAGMDALEAIARRFGYSLRPSGSAPPFRQPASTGARSGSGRLPASSPIPTSHPIPTATIRSRGSAAGACCAAPAAPPRPGWRIRATAIFSSPGAATSLRVFAPAPERRRELRCNRLNLY